MASQENWRTPIYQSFGLAFIIFCFTTYPALASIPYGKSYGSWHVTSISSISGDGDNDPMVALTQEAGSDLFEVRWSTGKVTVSLNIEDCNGERFEQSYSVYLERWLSMSSNALNSRLKADVSIWSDQVKFTCSSQIGWKEFDLKHVNPAVADFTRRLRYFAPSQGSTN